jgi:amidohydrolase
MESKSLKNRVIREVNRLRDELIRTSKAIHAYPEIAFEEHQSMALLADLAEKSGYQVDRGIAGLPTAFRARRASPKEGPTIAFLAEYDALPDLGHACGHNLIGTSSTGAALAMLAVLDSLPGTITLIGTPAEEKGGGKIILLEAGIFESVDIAMMVHPSTKTMTTRTSLAASPIFFEFFGKPAHASSSPETGINALEACIQTFNNVNALRQHLTTDIRIHGIIMQGGEAVNIVPQYAAAQFMVRALQSKTCLEVVEKVIRCARTAAEAMGARIQVSQERHYAEMRPNLTLAGVYKRNITQLGEIVEDPIPNQGMASSDMGNISHALPAIQPHIAITDPGTAAHTPAFCQASISDRGHEGMLKVAKALAMTAVDLLSNPELVSNIRLEFEKGKSLP